MAEALRIAIVGAESTGKTALAQALAVRLGLLTGRRCTWVGDWLRHWCEREGRTPRPDEQAAIAAQQHHLIDAAAADHEVVICDTTSLMTAVYSDLLLDDRSLVAYAMAQQRRCALTLLTALDIDWVADGLQRDGPQVCEPVDALVRAALGRAGANYSVVAGTGVARTHAALACVQRAIHPPPAGEGAARWHWHCERCGDSECERHPLLPRL